jgi:DNA-binding transcriptional LysR family regulator
MNLDLDHLESFLVLSEELHFGRAAQRLHMSQSGISRQIKLLEHSLGVPLVVRTTRRVHLTEAGGILAAKSGRLLKDINELKQLLSLAVPQPPTDRSATAS